MKKQLLVLASLFAFLFSSVQAEMGVNVGISGQMGLFGASATETEDSEKQREDDGMLAAGWASFFVEKTIGDRITIGVDYVPSAISSETTEKHTTDMTAGSNTNTAVTQKIKVDFNDLTTVYVALNITDAIYIKAGMSSMDVATKETLGTGSTYPDTSIDGNTFGIGTNIDMDNGVFFRAEANYMNFDASSVTSQTGLNKIEVSEINGASGSISIGKTF